MIAEEDEPKLLTWIIIQLNDINQSNATGLAKYIITLIKQNYGDIQELKTYYIEQLKSFLKNKTAIFVNILIDGLKEKKYQTIIHRDNSGDEDEVDYDENDEIPNYDNDDDDANRRGYKSNYTDHNNDNDDKDDNIDDDDSRRNRHRTSYGNNESDNKHTDTDNIKYVDNHSTYNQTNKITTNNIDKNSNNSKYQKHTGNTYVSSNMAAYSSQNPLEYRSFGASNNNNNTSMYLPPYSTGVINSNNSNNNPGSMGNMGSIGISSGSSMSLTESMPSFTNAYQQAVAAALHMPYNPITIPNFYNPISSMNNINTVISHLGDTNLHIVNQNAGRVSYEDELIAQHVPAMMTTSTTTTTTTSKPPPPCGPAPRTQQIQNNSMSYVDTDSSSFVYGANISSNPYQNLYGVVSSPPLTTTVSSTTTASMNNIQSSYLNKDNTNVNINIGKVKKFNVKHSQYLPENERCTLKCSGIPSYVTEVDIRNHFEAFGYIVELQIISNMNEEKSDDQQQQQQQQNEKKKVYNECLVQFYHAANAKKCLTSPLPVLNNRFIHLHASSFNVTPITDVDIPSQDILDRDFQLLSESMITPKSINTTISSSSSYNSNNMNRKKTAASFNMYTSGMSNKYRRVSGELDQVPTKVASTIVSSNSNQVEDIMEDNAIKQSQEEVQETLQTTSHHSDNMLDIAAIATTTTPTTLGKITIPPSVATLVQNKEKQVLIEKHEKLKLLRQQAEEILKKKENVLQEQLDKCRQMIDKLESSVDTDTKQTLLQSLEAKVLTFQTQLRSLREQMDKRNTSDIASSASTIAINTNTTVDIINPIYNYKSTHYNIRNNNQGGRISHHRGGGRISGRYHSNNPSFMRGGRFNNNNGGGGRISSNTVYIRSQTTEDDDDINDINTTSLNQVVIQPHNVDNMNYNQVINTDVVSES